MNSSASHMSQPPLSLLSLSDAAASAHHIQVQHLAAPPAAPILIKQRRRSSFSQSRKRRPSDARDTLLNYSEDRDRVASSRLQASLSLSPPGVNQGLVSKSAPMDGMKEEILQHGTKKKGTTFRCESCSKVSHHAVFPFAWPNLDYLPEFVQIYRHPSCLVKHRWEHSPHWREASKFLLSKHQQVQLLEACHVLHFCSRA
ncbi:hypothetical protein JB92DRAFT_2036500 [Gautieria morchelliformis]|nr:hypothetical protein JB92DRAFT_2036500 [Gautieria morchelliformis]